MIYNADNPYVLNEYYFSNITNVYYEDTLLSKIHFIYNLVMFICGSTTCCLLFYLTIKRTPQIFKEYSKLIFVTCLIDLVYLVNNFLAQYRFKIVEGAFMATVTGPLKYLPYAYQCISLPMSSGIQAASCLILPYIYLYRLLMIKNRKAPELYQTVAYILFCLAIILILFYTTFQGYCVDYKTNQLEYAQWWEVEARIPPIFIGFKTNKALGLSFLLYSGSNLICYVIAMILGYKTTQEIQRHALILSSRTLSMQKQLGRALFVQSLIPLSRILIPEIVSIITMFLKVEFKFGGLLTTFLIVLHPCLSPLSNLLFISYYRNFVLKAFPCCFKNADNVVSVAPLSSNNQQTN